MRTPILTLLCLSLLAPCTARAACDPNIPADLSGDCQVDFNDFAIMAADWLKPAVPHEWAARYNGPANTFDYARAIAVDSNDNIYVTGSTYGYGTNNQYDYATVKYSPDTNQAVWVSIYNGPDNDDDLPYAIAIDSNDNVYVTGTSFASATYLDYATIKYSPDSNQPVWVARYNGPASDFDVAHAIAIDSNDNVYVTGYSRDSGTSYDYATIKYSPDTNEPVWVARYNGPGNGSDRAQAIATDSKANIYVTGYSYGGVGTGTDFATIKYSPDSNQPVWVGRYSGSGNTVDSGSAIAIDSNDNVYVTGHSARSGTGDNYATIKYSPDSNQLVWVARYNGPASENDYARAIAIDSNDNIYVTGTSRGVPTGPDYATIKYSPDSNEAVWVATYDGAGDSDDFASAIAVDSKDNIYVVGESMLEGAAYNGDYATVKYSPDSNQPIWVATYNGPHSDEDTPFGLAIDSNDNIYVTGESTGSGAGYDFATVKYSPEYTCTPQMTGDFDHNCTVDIYDLAIFCQSWLDSTTPSI